MPEVRDGRQVQWEVRGLLARHRAPRATSGCVQNKSDKGNLYGHFVEDEEEEIGDAADLRAEADGQWPPELKSQLTDLAQSCTAKLAKRIGVQAALRQVVALERTHCAVTGSEEMLTLMRVERERVRETDQLHEAARRNAAMTCLICFDEEVQASDGGIECDKGHFFCASCVERSVCDELDQIANAPGLAEDHRSREGKLRCPQRCGELISDRQLARCLTDPTFSRYRQLQDEGYAEQIRQQAEIDTRAQIEREREQGNVARRAQEEAQTEGMLENEIRAGRMKRCPNCRTGVQRAGGCDHMHCRGAGGCGAHFCFVCEAIPSNNPTCPGRGRQHQMM